MVGESSRFLLNEAKAHINSSLSTLPTGIDTFRRGSMDLVGEDILGGR